MKVSILVILASIIIIFSYIILIGQLKEAEELIQFQQHMMTEKEFIIINLNNQISESEILCRQLETKYNICFDQLQLCKEN